MEIYKATFDNPRFEVLPLDSFNDCLWGLLGHVYELAQRA